jgi:hypothetical protein
LTAFSTVSAQSRRARAVNFAVGYTPVTASLLHSVSSLCTPGCVVQELLLRRFQHPDERARTLLNPSGPIQHSEIAFPKPGVRGSSPLRDASSFNLLLPNLARVAVHDPDKPDIDRTRQGEFSLVMLLPKSRKRIEGQRERMRRTSRGKCRDLPTPSVMRDRSRRNAMRLLLRGEIVVIAEKG